MKNSSFVFIPVLKHVEIKNRCVFGQRCFYSSGKLYMKENTIWVMAECKNRDAIALSEWREHGGTMPLDIILYALY